MIRISLYTLLLSCALLVLAGCSRPKTIPDDKLESIFEDIFLANSYYNFQGGKSGLDSMDMYRPILKKHGYKITDLTYTIENYSKRKSAKISDVVEASIRRLEKAESYYSDLVTRRDSLEAKAIRQFSDTVYYDSLIQVFSLDDTAKLRIEIPVEQGDYHISFTFLIDSLDRNGRPVSLYQLRDGNGRVTHSVNRGMATRRETPAAISLEAKPGDSTLLIRLAGYGPNMKPPHVTLNNLRIIYNPPVEAALDSLFLYQRAEIYTFPAYVEQLDPDTPYRGTLRADPPRLSQGRDDNP